MLPLLSCIPASIMGAHPHAFYITFLDSIWDGSKVAGALHCSVAAHVEQPGLK